MPWLTPHRRGLDSRWGREAVRQWCLDHPTYPPPAGPLAVIQESGERGESSEIPAMFIPRDRPTPKRHAGRAKASFSGVSK